MHAVRENKGYFSEYNLKSDLLDEFYMRYLKWSIHYKNFCCSTFLGIYHGQAAAEHGFSLNYKLLVVNMKIESLIAQRCLKDFMIANNYSSHNVPIAKR